MYGDYLWEMGSKTTIDFEKNLGNDDEVKSSNEDELHEGDNHESEDSTKDNGPTTDTGDQVGSRCL